MKKSACFVVFICAVVVLFAGNARGDVPLDDIHFPDENFRAYVMHTFDWNGDGSLSDYEISKAEYVNLNESTYAVHYVESLKGIEYFTALKSLYCEFSGLVTLDLSHNTALESLICSFNRLTSLNVSGCKSLRTLYCNYNQLTSLNLSGCPALVNLSCSYNQLTSLNVSGTALTTMNADCNYIKNLTLNDSLSWIHSAMSVSGLAKTGLNRCYGNYIGAELSGLVINAAQPPENDPTKWYQINLNSYFPNAHKYSVSFLDANNESLSMGGSRGSQKNDNGVWIFADPFNNASKVRSIRAYTTYDIGGIQVITTYYVHMGAVPSYHVYEPPSPVAPSFKAEVIEGKLNTDKIICRMDPDYYYDSKGRVLTEKNIADYSYRDYGKLGFAADGNSRLIIRVKSDRPGRAVFSFNGTMGAKIEKLTDRTVMRNIGNMYNENSVEAVEVSKGVYQASAVLIAPENFPEDMNFPSDKFTVNVGFFAGESLDLNVLDTNYSYLQGQRKFYTGSVKSLELKIDVAPVMLLHGLFGTTAKTFGDGKSKGIMHSLKSEGFEVLPCDYSGFMPPSKIGGSDFNILFRTLSGAFTKYAERGIVCTRGDIVAFGMGGLVADEFLKENGYASDNGNNWTVNSYKQGMVRRFISIAAPYCGTPWADILTGVADISGFNYSPAVTIADFVLTKLFGTAYFKNLQGALSEMRTDRSYSPPDVYAHAIYGDASNLLDTTGYAVDLLGDAAIEFGMGLFMTPWSGLAPVMCIVGLGAKFASIGEGLLSALFYEGHDLVVGVSSANGRGTFSGNSSTCYTGLKSFHSSLAGRNDIGGRIAELLKGDTDSFSITNVSSRATIPSVKSIPASVKSSGSANFTESFKLSISPSVFTASGNNTQTITISAVSEKAVNGEVYLAIGNDDECRIFRLSSSDKTGKKFGGKLIFTSQDIGVIKALCFAHNSGGTGTSLNISNIASTVSLEDANSSSLKITTVASLPTVSRRQAYSVALKADGAVTAWSVVNGELPTGLSLNATTGKISGTPTKAGTYKFTLLAENDGGYDAKEFTVKVTQTTLTGDIPASTTRRATYTGTPKVSGGASPYVWTISTGKLPDGLKINASTGKITGNPTKTGTFKFTVKAKDKNGAASTKAYTLKVTQTTLTGDIPANTTRRASYTGTPKVSGGASPYVWTISTGKLPDGLKINASTGKITGSATKAGTFKFTVKAKDKNGAASTKQYTVKVTQTTLTGDIPASTTRRATFTGTPKASGGASPYVWSIGAGKLPDGLKLNSSTGKITGVASKAGTFTFTVKAKDKNGAAGTKAYTVKVTQTKVTGTLANAVKGSSYTATPKASNGASPYVWSVSSGNLPTGLKLNSSTGKISGTPSKTGSYTFTIKAKDKNGAAGTKSFTVKVTASASAAKSSLIERTSTTHDTVGISAKEHSTVSALPATTAETAHESGGITSVILPASLHVVSNDILESHDGKDSDIITVKAGKPLTFVLGDWGVNVSGVTVCVDDEPAEGISISPEGVFTFPAEWVYDDFRVSVKATYEGSEIESEELYITSQD